MRFVERHWKIVLGGSDRPTGNHSPPRNVGDFNFLSVGDVHKKRGPRPLQLKRFKMGIDDYIADSFSILVEKAQPSASFRAFPQLLRSGVPNDHTLGASVVANIVGVVWEFDSRQQLKGSSIKHPGDSVKAAGNEQMIRGRVVEHPLRLREVGDGVHAPPRFQVDDLERMVLNRRDKQALAHHVNAEVIDTSFHVGQSDGGFKRKRPGIPIISPALYNEALGEQP